MKRIIALLLISLASITTLSGCYGKFALTRKLYQVNSSVGDKFLRTGLTWVFVFFPAYEVSAIIDFIFFNTIEFWSGNNPVANGEKDFQYVKGSDSYDIHVVRTGNEIDFTIKHRNRLDGTLEASKVHTDLTSGTSFVTTNAGNAPREYVTSLDGERVRLDRYAGNRLEQVSYVTPRGRQTGEQFAAAR